MEKMVIKILRLIFSKVNKFNKLKSMKLGTFGVKGDKETIKIKPGLMLIIQKGKLQSCSKSKRRIKISNN